MFKRLFAAVLFFWVSGCSSIPEKPVLNAEPINAAGKFNQYWITEKDQQNAILTLKQRNLLQKHSVKVVTTYLVDSNGNVYDVKITESNGEGLFAEKVKLSLQRRVYKPA
ncbi:hypothetical protein JQC92_21165, partial [Shewanella sp. 202IG2-18]|uniref:hypothetical protein n=1 Tax=Parashewanella hymeniacidonis TaxID=2807618 RepID=UPI00196029D5